MPVETFMLDSRHIGKLLFIAILLAAGCFEAIVAILQHDGRMESTHPVFLVTGTFPNPGPLGGFLAVNLTLLWGVIPMLRNRCIRLLSALPLFIIAYALVLTDSRAGWMGASAGIVCMSAWHGRKYLRRRFNSPRRRMHALLTTAILSAGIVFLAYSYRPTSANGRLLIWRVCADMIADKPLFGFGFNGFTNHYMLYQAEYFRLHPDSGFAQCADNTAYPYNEWIHAAVDFGLTGLALLLLLYGVLSCPSSTRTNAVLKSGFMALLIFGCFSYPTYVFRLSILYPLFIVSLENRFVRRRGTKMAGTVALLACVALSGCYEIARYRMETDCRKLFVRNESVKQAAAARMDAHYGRLKLFPRCMDLYAQYAMKELDEEKCLGIIADAMRIVPSSGLYCDAGDLYRVRQKELAAEYYMKAANMTPRRVLPLYKLFLLRFDNRQWERAAEIGRTVLSMPIAVRGTKTLGMLAEVAEKMATVETMLAHPPRCAGAVPENPADRKNCGEIR